MSVIRKHIALPEHEAQAVAFWIMLTYFIKDLEHAPILLIGSPQKGCGKTNLMKLLQYLVYRALKTSSISESGLFRTIEDDQPTLLLDEAETFIKGHEGMRGLIDSGYEAGEQKILTNPVTYKREKFSIFCLKAMAGLGRLADTIEDRSIPITLQRRPKSVKIVRMRNRDKAQITRLKRQIRRWSDDNREAVQCHEPTIPEVMGDREVDKWFSIFSIADTVGGLWSQRARQVALVISGKRDDTNFSVILLQGLRAILEDPGHAHQDFFSSAGLVMALNRDEEAPWQKLGHGDEKGLTVEKLASTLKPYGLKSYQKRTPDGIKRGFDRKPLEDTIDQYLEKTRYIVTETRQSSPRAASEVSRVEKEDEIEKQPVTPANQVPERLPEELSRGNGLKQGTEEISSLDTQNGTSNTQMKALSEEDEARRLETRRWLEEEWLPKHPPTKHMKYESSDDGKQYDLVGVRKLITRLQEEKRAKDTTSRR